VRGTGTLSRDWRLTIDGEVRGAVATAEIAVVASSGIVGGESVATLHAISLNSGAEIWKRSFKKDDDGNLSVSHPIIVGENVFVSATRSATDTNASVVVAVSIRDGTVSWKKTFDSFTLSMAAPWLLLGRTDPQSGYIALHPETGTKCWMYKPWRQGFLRTGGEEQVAGYPAIADETIVTVVSKDPDHYLAGVNPQNGQEKWRTKMTREPPKLAAPSVIEGSVLVPTEHRVWAHNLEDGQLAWKTAQIRDTSLTFMAANQSTIVVTGTSLHVIDRQSKTKRWTIEEGGRPIIAGRTVYIPTAKKTGDGEYTNFLHTINAHSGEIVGEYPLTGSMRTRPLIAGGKLVLAMDGDDGENAVRSVTIEAVSRS